MEFNIKAIKVDVNTVTRRAFFTVCIVTIFLFGTVQAQTQKKKPDDDLKMIKELIQQEIDFWNKGDIEGYVSLYAPVDSVRMIYNGVPGAVYGRDNILAFYKKNWPKERMGKLSFTGVHLERLSVDYFFASGFFHVNYPDGKKAEGRFSGLMKKIDGRWYLYTDHAG